ncbi:Clavesin-2 [Folsomia candida]|uniref:Clavesin-2 n=1 Tax=Folsomia candida TaxID=158441 RepID=A0A226DJF4_FOLCA|nr:Clavesin-2 [Folsomia candida]
MGTQYPNKISALVELKSKLAEHQKLHKIEDILDDAMLIGFLNGKKYNVNDSLKCLEQFVYIRTEKYPSFSMKYLIPSTLPMLDVQCIRTLKYMDKGCRRIGVGQISLWDPSKNNVHELLAENVLHLDESIRNYMTHSEGNEFIMIIDMAGFCVQHFRNATPSRIVQYFDFFLPPEAETVISNSSRKNLARVCKQFYLNILLRNRSELLVTIDEELFSLQVTNWLMVVGAMSCRGVLPLIKVPQKVKESSKYYVDLVLKPLLEYNFPNLHGKIIIKVIFHHDGASSQTAKLTQDYANDLEPRLGIKIIWNNGVWKKLKRVSQLLGAVGEAFLKLFIHDDFASLHDHLPATALPVSLGGHLSDEDAFENEFVPGIRNQERFYTRMAELAMVS